MGFSSVSGAVSVRFACPKGFVESEGRVVSDTEVSFLTPSFEKFGPMQVKPSALSRTVGLRCTNPAKMIHGDV